MAGVALGFFLLVGVGLCQSVYVVLVVVVTGGSMASVDGWVLVSVLGVLVT